MEDNHVQELIGKYLNGTATKAERLLVESHYLHLLSRDGGIAGRQMVREATDKMRHAVVEQTGTRLIGASGRTSISVWVKLAAILIAILSVAVSLYWYSREHTQQYELINQQVSDIPPGGNRATLTFSDGSSIKLDENKSGIVMGESLSYDDGTTIPVEKATEYATITTPNGGQYQVTLPDGSKVWLNAASSLRYPTAFTGNEREVVLTGEGYFQVTENKRQPFIVESNGQSLQVLGTSFNVNAYTDEATVTTTLVSGSVKLYRTPGGPQQLLQPGEQATMLLDGFSLRQVDVLDYVSWKTGLIVLNDANLPAIVRQVERWYDVEFIMPEVSTSVKVFGELRRDVRLSEILDALKEYYGLTFEIQGRRVIVSE